MQLRDALSGDAALESGHFSFQIRLPYIMGVVHTVDFHALFAELGVTEITDGVPGTRVAAPDPGVLQRSGEREKGSCMGRGTEEEAKAQSEVKNSTPSPMTIPT